MVFQHRTSSETIKPNYKELYRYAGIINQKEIDESIKSLAKEAVLEIQSVMNCRSIYIKLPLEILDIDVKNDANDKPKKIIKFGEYSIQSYHLWLNLKDSYQVYLFAATLGSEVDKIIQKSTKINPPKSVMHQAAGAMFIEEYCQILCDFLQKEEEKQGNTLNIRYSPGFGDVSLEVQKIFFKILQCQKNLALTLNDSLIMSPEKSVTAFIGVKKEAL